MRVWVDDVRDPTDDGNEWTVCRTAEEALSLLESVDPDDEWSLDHDLGSGRMTGYDLLKEMERLVFYEGWTPPRRVFIHTANPVGRDQMMACRKSMYEEHWRQLDR